MAVSLAKIVDGKPALADELPNQQIVKCPRCDQTYRFGSSDNEWNHLPHLLTLAERAIRESHKNKHEASSLALNWNPRRDNARSVHASESKTGPRPFEAQGKRSAAATLREDCGEGARGGRSGHNPSRLRVNHVVPLQGSKERFIAGEVREASLCKADGYKDIRNGTGLKTRHYT